MSSATPTHDYTARARLFGGNRMKLGVMAFNCSHGSTITTVPEAWNLNRPDPKDIAQAGDPAGLGALLPVGRWKGYRRPPHPPNAPSHRRSPAPPHRPRAHHRTSTPP